MLKMKRYRYNHKTLAYELHQTPLKMLFSRGFVLFLCTIVTSVGYFWMYSSYLKLDTPKMLELKRQNVDLLAKLDLMNHQIEKCDFQLERLKQRDNNIYRPIFGMGMKGVSDDERNAGFGGVERYSYLNYSQNSRFLTEIALNVDRLSKKTVVQSRSFDEVGRLAERTDEMAASIPAILPVNFAESGTRMFRIAGAWGYRNDPIYGDRRMHDGIDITGPIGAEVYATGDGTVIKRQFEIFGYGNYIIIDHGFGYKTRYAHLKSGGVMVMEGQKVSRGERIGFLGNTGKSTGPHLHYEVIFQDRTVNPLNFFSNDLSVEEYDALIGTAKGQ
jgi:hypothetical protein